MYKYIALFSVLQIFVIGITYALVDCRETTNGCTISQLVDIGDTLPTSKEDRASAYRSAIKKINLKIDELEKSQTPTDQECVNLKNNLWLGKGDKETGGEVTLLQKFLVSQNYLDVANVSGYYGNKTAEAVLRFQKEKGMTGVTFKSGVGITTRAKIGCISSSVLNSAYIKSITPSSGSLGTSVEILGSGLSSFENDIVFIFEKSDGKQFPIYVAGDNSKTLSTRRVLTVKDQCKKGESWYNPVSQSGIPGACVSEPLTPGVYKVYSEYPKTNAVTFTITQ